MASTKTAKKTQSIQWDMTKVVIYRRVSTREQGDSQLGLEAQLNQCRTACESIGLTIVGDFVEVVSGKADPRERPHLMAAIALCQKEGARLMVAKLDRFSREVYHVTGYCDRYFFAERTPDLICAESPKATMLEIRIRAVVAQEEREMIGKRTKAALAARKERGDAPNGEAGRASHLQKTYQATEAAMQLARSMRKLGHGYHTIAKALNEAGHTTSKGGQWYPANIRQRLLQVTTVGVS